MTKPPARLLVVGGSDSSGGAGIQADVKTATALGVYAMTAITAVTAQDTTGVQAIELMPPALVRAQIICCLSDIGADAIKIGMLGSADIANAVADTLEQHAHGIPLVLDPVLASTSGTPLMDEAGIEVLKTRLIPISALVAPNLPELQILTSGEHPDRLITFGAAAVLVKGGHAEGDFTIDILHTGKTVSTFRNVRLDTPHTHGTGCTLATAIACGLAQGMTLVDAVTRARDFVQEAIATAPGLGRGHGPLNHMHGIPR